MYTTIIHEARQVLRLNTNEYIYCDITYHLANNPNSKHRGWSIASKPTMAKWLGVSKRTISNIIKSTSEKGLIELDKTGRKKRTTAKWYNAVHAMGYKTNRSIESVKCHYCGVSILEAEFEVDHYIPKSQGGSDDPSNLVLSCSKCNSEKGTLTGDQFKAWLDTIAMNEEKNPDINSAKVAPFESINSAKVAPFESVNSAKVAPNTNKLNTNKLNTNSGRFDFYDTFDFFKGEFEQIWFDEFLPLKKKKRASLSERSLRDGLKKIKTLSQNRYAVALAILKKSVDSGWTGFYAIREDEVNINNTGDQINFATNRDD